MSYNRRKALTVLGAATAAAILPSAPSRAGTAPQITFISHSPDADGTLLVGANSSVPMTSAKARILTQQGGSLIHEITDTTYVPWYDHNGSWRTSSPVILPDLGLFWIEWEIHTADGGVSTGGDFIIYWRVPTFTEFIVNPQVVTSRSHTLTFSGQVTWRHPGTLAVAPLANFPVSIDDRNNGVLEAMTDAQGRFAGELKTTSGIRELVATIQPMPGLNVWNADARQPVQAIWTETRLTLGPHPISIVEGQATTVSGKLEQLWDGAWEPLPGRRVNIYMDNSHHHLTHHAAVLTNASGVYSYTFVPPTPGFINAAYRRDDSEDSFFLASEADEIWLYHMTPIPFSDEVYLSRSADPARPATWKFTGFLKPGSWTVRAPVEIQWSADASSHWITLATVWPDSFSLQPGYRFVAEIDVYQACYVRAYLPQTISTLPSWTASYALPAPVIPRMTDEPSPEQPPVPRL